MRLKNHTDIPDDIIRDIIRRVRPAGIGGFDVRISNCAGRGGRGRAYHAGSGYHDRACPFIVISIPRTDKEAQVIRHEHGGQGYLPVITGNRFEALVYILAHELRHLWQAKVKRGWRVYGSRGQFSERDASAYGLQRLRQYRREGLLADKQPERR